MNKIKELHKPTNTALLQVAPMMSHTNRHCRYLLRLLSPHALLYSEMITTGAVLHGDRARFLDFDEKEHPVVLQLGGNDPKQLGECAKIAQQWGYDAVNLNVGCPSDRVQSGQFGACLMKQPALVARCVAEMVHACDIPVTVKTRIGVDEQDSYEQLVYFIQTVAASGCDTFVIHARKAWLNGLNPKQNRTVPPLRYDIVAQLKRDFPTLTFVLNGGITTLQETVNTLEQFDAVMLGRAAIDRPYLLADIEHAIYGTVKPNRVEVAKHYLPYVEQQLKQGVYLSHLIKPLFGLFKGMPGAASWRRYLSENSRADDSNVLFSAIKMVSNT